MKFLGDKKVYSCKYCKTTYKRNGNAKNCEAKCLSSTKKIEVAEKSKQHHYALVENLNEIKRLPVFLYQYLEEIYNVKVVSIIIIWVKYDDSVSNSHSCPLNGVTNFMVDDDKPDGYKGYSGEMKILCLKDQEGYVNFTPAFLGNNDREIRLKSHLHKDMSITYYGLRGFNTGSYSGNSVKIPYKNKEYDATVFRMGFKLFLDDFKGLQKEINLYKLLNKDYKFKISVGYEDPKRNTV